MTDKELLDLCLRITGSFENGTPQYDGIAGNADGCGISVGILQWNAGTGTIQTLVNAIATKTGWDKAQSFFRSDIHHFAVLKPKEAIQFALDHYIEDGALDVAPAAKACWQSFLSQPESVAAQIELATNTVLLRAKTLAKTFIPDHADSTRVLAFFFDLVTQSGGMENKRGKVEALPTGSDPDITEVLEFTHDKNLKVAGMWEIVTQEDALARLLLHYAYCRSMLSNPPYVWDALSRRGAIACRTGIVHGAKVDFTSKLD